jgi:hypothetical protein
VKNYVLAMFIFLCGLAPAYATTSTGWICQVGMTKASSIPIRYEVRQKRLLGYEDDLTGKPNIYTIRSNTAKKLVAIRVLNRRPVIITIDKPSGRFLQRTSLRNYRERNSGVCSAFGR